MDSFTVFFRRVTRIKPYVPANTGRYDDEFASGYVTVFDPYEPYDKVPDLRSPPQSAGMAVGADTPARRIMTRYRQASADSAVMPLMNRV